MAAEKTSSQPAGRLPVFEAAAMFYLALHLFAAVTGSVYLWGVDSWRVLPGWGQYVVFVLGAALLIPRVQDTLGAFLSKSARFISKVPTIIFPLAGGLLFWLFRCRTFFLGDGMLRLRNITSHFDSGLTFPLMTYEEPLDTFLHSGLYMLLHPKAGVSAQDIYQWVSIIAGMLAVWLIIRFNRRAGSQQILTPLLILTTGTVLLFFGYVESYTVAWVCALGALLTGLDMIESRRFSLVAAWWFALAVAIHPTVLTLAPGIVYAYLFATGHTSVKKKRPVFLAGAVGVAALVCGVTAVLLHYAGRTFAGFTETAGGSHFLPLIGNTESYGIFSLTHLIDMANELALILPAGLVLFPGGWRIGELRRSVRFRFLTIALVGPLLWLLLIDPKLGFARDWDLFSLLSLPGALILAELLGRVPAERVWRVIIPVIGIALLHTVPWIALNASEDASFERFRRLTDTPHWSDDATAMAWESLASYYSAHEQYSVAGEGYARAYDLTGNHRFYLNVIAMYQRSGEPDVLARFVHSHTDDAEGYYYLGELYLRLARPSEAAEALAHAVELNPDVPDGYLNLGIALADTEHFPEAIDAYTEALERTENADTRALILTNRANVQFATNEIPSAIVDYREAIDLAPGYGLPRFNLALVYFRMGDIDSAQRLLTEADSLGYSGDDVERLRGMMGE